MLLALVAVVTGLILLVWSADRFIDASSALARRLAVTPLLIGMVIVGFGTSMPEITVSALSAWQGNPGIALGNAYGSNIANIGLILGITALISPIVVQSDILRRELPILVLVSLLTVVLLMDLVIDRLDAWLLVAVFLGLFAWTVGRGLRAHGDSLAGEMKQKLATPPMPVRPALFWLVTGLVVLVASSRLLVWGAVEIARDLGVNELVIGLTVVAIGTSLPELASSISAARKGEHEIALGNVLGSNLFNTLAVVGIAGAIHPLSAPTEILVRDLPVMVAMTASLFVIGSPFGDRQGRVNRIEGAVLVGCFAGYTGFLVNQVLAGQ